METASTYLDGRSERHLGIHLRHNASHMISNMSYKSIGTQEVKYTLRDKDTMEVILVQGGLRRTPLITNTNTTMILGKVDYLTRILTNLLA